jgi:branched-chain amino acid transport system ATP-binding protein
MTEQNVDFALDLGERSYIIDRGANVWEGTTEELHQREDLLDEYLSVGAQEAD